jgi:hypothetical protein
MAERASKKTRVRFVPVGRDGRSLAAPEQQKVVSGVKFRVVSSVQAGVTA